MRTQSRRQFVTLAGSIGIGGLAGCLGGGEPDPTGNGDEPDELPSVEAVAGATGFGQAFVHHYAGLLEFLPEFSDGRHSVEIRQVDSAALHIQAVIQGSINYYRGSLGHPLNAHNAGTPIRIIGAGSIGNQWVLVLHEDYDGLEPFVTGDAQMASASPGGSTHQNIVAAIEAEGLDSSEVNYVRVGPSSDRAAAVAGGTVDGTLLRIDQWVELEGEVPYYLYLELADVYPVFPNAIAVPASWLEDEAQEDHAAHLVKGLVHAGHLAMTDFEWFLENFQRYIGQQADREEIRAAWEINTQQLADFPYKEEHFTVDAFQSVYDNLVVPAGVVPPDANIDISEIVVEDYWNQAVDELGIE